VTEPDDALRDALRDLIPDYTGPADPVARVVATVRRRRVRRRALLAVGGTGLAAVLALVVPALVLSPPGGGLPAAAPGRPDPPTPSPAPVTGVPAGPAPAAPVVPVASGTVHGAAWSVASSSFGPGVRLCVISDDEVSRMQVVCFDGWTAGDPVTWIAQHWSDHGPRVTRIAGVAPAGTARVRIRLAAGSDPLTIPVRQTATDPGARFFGVFRPGTVAVRDVTALDAGGRALGPPTAEAAYPCTPGPDAGCAPAVNPSRSPSR
jgi:hypothetical protein